ncbi:MAG TPA: hypothetical protein VLF62_06490 [Candidatus Saccharimonadales bacterium]|nr:hypothetical protein [Candidatus Saccharimonadales bacterium]
MSGKKGGRPGQSVSPVTWRQLAERYARTTGDPQAAHVEDMKYQLAIGGQCLDEVALARTVRGFPVKRLPIGQYDPARGKWLFPSEYVKSNETPMLERAIKKESVDVLRNIGAAAVEGGHPMVDVYHPFTAKIRKELAAIMRPLTASGFLMRPGVRDGLRADPPSTILGMDNYTTVYPLMATRAETHIDVEVGADEIITEPSISGQSAGILVLHASGVKVNQPEGDPRHTYRDNRAVILAERDPATQVLVPNEEIVTPGDMEVLSAVHERLFAAREENPNFSLLFCSVVYGDEYANASIQKI